MCYVYEFRYWVMRHIDDIKLSDKLRKSRAGNARMSLRHGNKKLNGNLRLKIQLLAVTLFAFSVHIPFMFQYDIVPGICTTYTKSSGLTAEEGIWDNITFHCWTHELSTLAKNQPGWNIYAYIYEVKGTYTAHNSTY